MIGQTISHYKVTQKLGGGGMGIVYKAEDTHLHRPVALKFLPPELTRDEKAKQRFIQEARAASSLDHPNICTIYEINEDEAGHSFISMAYYEGLTLKQKLEDGPLPVAEAREILTNIARGLSKAHENGIIHRDIKPANIFITNDGMVKILDFGIAKLAGQSQLTRTGSTIGTMVYMSPEQIQGKPVDQRTDLWSLGVISYEMLAGWPPYQGEYEQALMYAILTESPDPIREMNTEVSPLLVDIIRKCLAKNPEERYTSVTALLKDLQREAPGTESTSTPITSQSPVRRTVRRHTRTVLLSGVLAVILVLAMLAYRQNTGSSQPPDRLAVAVTDFENTTGENELEGLSGLFITALEQSRNLSVLTRSRMFDLMKQMGGEPGDRINESVGQEIARYANIHALVTATIRKFDQVYTIELNVIDPIRDEYLFTATAKGNTKGSIPGMIDQLAEDTRRSLREKNDEIQQATQNVAQLTTPNLEAYQHFFQGEEHINRLEFQEAIPEFQQAIALDTSFGLAYARLAYVRWWLSPLEGFTEEPLRKALAHLNRIPEKEQYLLRAQAVKLEGGDYADGVPILQRGIELYPNDKELVYNLGDFAYHAHELKLAIEQFERVLNMDPNHERALQHLTWAYRDINDPTRMNAIARRYVKATGTSEAYNLLAESHLMSGDLEEATAIARNQVTLNPDNADARVITGNVLIFSDHIEEGLAAYDSALTHVTEAYKMPLIHMQRGAALAYLGRYSESDASYRRGFERAGNYGETPMVLEKEAQFHLALGYNRFVRGRYQEALSEFQQARKIKPDAPHVLRDLGITYAQTGRLNEARAIADSIVGVNQGETDHYYYYVMGHVALEEGQYSRATQYFQQSSERLASPHLYFLPLIQATAQNGDTGSAIHLLEEMLQSQGCYCMDSSLHYFTWLYYPYGVYLLGTLYEKSGQTELAIQKYRQVVHIWKNSDEDIPELHDAKQRLSKLEVKSLEQEAISSAADNS